MKSCNSSPLIEAIKTTSCTVTGRATAYSAGMGGATRIMILLTAPFPPLRPSLNLIHRRISSLSGANLRLHSLSSFSKLKTLHPQTASCFHSQPGNNTYALQSSATSQQQHHHLHHPWPEWNSFLIFLSNGRGYSVPEGDRIHPPEDAFVVYEKLTDDFVSAAAACITFARARPDLIGLLSRRDIEAVVSNGTPFLFRSALDAARRMRAFLGTDSSNVSEVDIARTVDLMKYIISYASNPTSSTERNGLYSRELVDLSVRNLLHEMFTLCGGVPTGDVPLSSPKPFGQNIEMKRGDWICQKCTFMNFARNTKCLECEEPRPKKQLTGGEWECPQCNFFNNGRKVVCLRCDCRRPGAPLFNNIYSQNGGTKFSSVSPSSDIRYPGSSNSNHTSFVPLPADAFSRTRQTPEMDDGNKVPLESNTASSDIRNRTIASSKSEASARSFQSAKDSASQIDSPNNEAEQTEKSERWFQRMAELQNVIDLPSVVSDEEFPEIMPMRKGENRFVVSKNKDRSLTSPQYKRQVAMDQANNTTFVPFVPFPPGYFAKQDTEQPSRPDSSTEIREQTDKLDAKHGRVDSSGALKKDQNITSSVNSKCPREHNQPSSSSEQIAVDYSTHPSVSHAQSSITSHSTGTGGSLSQLPKNENARSSLEGSAVKEPEPLDMSEEAKAERWFKRVAQIKDISELSQIPDEDFPSIMPMRKGVNRFVVSKRKTPLERRLTSQQYRRNLPVVTNNPSRKEGDNSESD